MPVFTFSGKSASGEKISGERTAANKDVLLQQLRRERITPGSVREKGKEFALPTFGSAKVKTKDIAIFFRQFSVMIDAGLPLVQCLEILVPNAAIRNLIREDKIHQIYSAMQSGQEKFGMQTFNQSLATAYFQKQITLETALQRSSNQDELQEMINRGAGLLNKPTSAGMAKAAAPAKR